MNNANKQCWLFDLTVFSSPHGKYLHSFVKMLLLLVGLSVPEDQRYVGNQKDQQRHVLGSGRGELLNMLRPANLLTWILYVISFQCLFFLTSPLCTCIK